VDKQKIIALLVIMEGVTLRSLSLGNASRWCMLIKKIMEYGENWLQFARESYLDILCRCKIIARNKRKKRLCNEKYLGNRSFANEIHCSYDEFAIIVSTLGYHPLRV
jgi:hypothetical protein